MTTPPQPSITATPTPNCGPPPVDYTAKIMEAAKAGAATYVYAAADGPNPCGLTHMSRLAHALTPEDQAQVLADIEAEQAAPVVTPLATAPAPKPNA